MNIEPGCRIGALAFVNKELIAFLGYGVYEGNFEPPGFEPPTVETLMGVEVARAIGGDDDKLRRLAESFLKSADYEALRKVPRLKLDNGSVAWAHECHWGAEHIMKQLIEKIVGQMKLPVVIHRPLRDEKGCCTDFVVMQ